VATIQAAIRSGHLGAAARGADTADVADTD
jgi:hypothetical protein